MLAGMLAISPVSMLAAELAQPELRDEYGAIESADFDIGSGWTMEITKRPDMPEHSGLRFVNTTSWTKGSIGILEFDLRDAGAHPDTARLLIFFRGIAQAQNHPLSLHLEAMADGQWRRFSFPFTMAYDFPPGSAELLLMPGMQVQRMEIANVQLKRAPEGSNIRDIPVEGFFYRGREPDAAWRKTAAQRIDRIRKSEVRVLLADADGRPVANAEVRLTLLRHAFRFGSAIDAGFVLGEGNDSERYREVFLRHFNAAVPENDLKWKALEGEWEGFTMDRALKLLDWCAAHGLYTRGHTLVWPSWPMLPERLEPHRESSEIIRREVDDHIKKVATATRGRIREWDVLNEPRSHRDLQNLLGESAVAHWFELAHATDPDAILYLNENGILSEGGRDTHHHDAFESLLRELLGRGVPVSGIGLQAHMGWTLTDPERLWHIYDRFSGFGLPITVTEFGVNIFNEQLQADYTRDFLTAAFSHPAVHGVLHWGFWEGRHWNPDAALYRKDWTPRASAQMLERLLREEWHTQITKTTDADGGFSLRAFHGDYRVEVTLPDGTRRHYESRIAPGQSELHLR